MGPVDSRVVVFDKVSTANGIVPFIADMANINLGVVVLGAKKNSALHQRVGQAEHDQSSSFRRRARVHERWCDSGPKHFSFWELKNLAFDALTSLHLSMTAFGTYGMKVNHPFFPSKIAHEPGICVGPSSLQTLMCAGFPPLINAR